MRPNSKQCALPLGMWILVALWFGFAPFAEGVALTGLRAEGFESSFTAVESRDVVSGDVLTKTHVPSLEHSDMATEEYSELEIRLRPLLVTQLLSQAFPNRPGPGATELSCFGVAAKEMLFLVRTHLLGLPPPSSI